MKLVNKGLKYRINYGSGKALLLKRKGNGFVVPGDQKLVEVLVTSIQV